LTTSAYDLAPGEKLKLTTVGDASLLDGCRFRAEDCRTLRSGSMHLAGRDVTRWPEHERAKFIGRVFQNPFSGTAPNMSIAENLAMAARRGQRRGLGWTLRAGLMKDLVDRVSRLNLGLEHRLDNWMKLSRRCSGEHTCSHFLADLRHAGLCGLAPL
jgi:hypothetical protein